MNVIKIGAIWCGACLITNKAWNKLKNEYSFSYSEYDIDMDEDAVKKYNPGDKLPIFIIMDGDSELTRFVGEYSYDELKNKLIEEGVINEKSI